MKSCRIAAILALAGAFAMAGDLSIPVPGGLDFVLKAIPPGSFSMGAEGIAQPVHPVTLSKAFYMSQCEVTQGQWQALMGRNPSHFAGDPRLPVEQVSWEDTQAFLKALNGATASSRPAGTEFRLPTEAEWEYACRAGSTTTYTFGNADSLLGTMGWFGANASYTTQPTGTKRPNAWGLMDMYGNVSEWCQDWFAPYSGEAQTDPTGPASGAYKVLRGGSWAQAGDACSSVARSLQAPATTTSRAGFRVVLVPR